MSNISYIRILQAIESFASAHLQVKKFGSDFPSQMPNFATEDEAYPILFVSPTTSIFDENTNTFQIDVYCFDIIQKDRNNINTILSDTNQIINDLDRWLKDGDIAGIDVVTTSTAVPLNNALLDYAAGWQMSMTLTTDTYGICEIPFSEVPVITTEVNNIIYQSFLTCENLASCETFESAVNDLQNQINNLTGGTEFDCNQLSGCTIIQDIDLELSGLTSQINELSATTESIQENYVPYIGATQDLNLGYNTFRNNNGLLVSWENGGANFGYDYIGDAKQMYFYDSDTSNNFNYSGQTIDFICNLEEGWGTSIYGWDFNDGTLRTSTIYNNTNGAGFNTQYGDNKKSQVTTSAGDIILSNLTDNAGPLMQSYIRLWKYYTQLSISNIDTTEANSIEMYTDRTYTKKYITTDEGFEGNYLQLNTAAAEASAVGKLKWNDTDGTVDLGLKGGNVILRIGEQTVVRVINKTGTLISKGSVVKVVQVTGGVTGIALAQADSDTNSSTTIGIVAEDIANNSQGFIIIQGLIHGLNTNAFTEGDVLYLSPTTAGALTNVKPVAPQHMVIVGYVAKKNATDGHILLHVQNGYELDELHNVKISAATGGEVLTYNGSTQVWENKKVYNDLQIRRNGITIYDDLIGTGASDFFQKLTFNSGGWSVSTFSNENNPGVIAITSSVASASSGGSIIPSSSVSPRNYAVGVGMQFDLIMRTSALSANVIMRFGIIAGTTNATQPSDGVYLRLNNNDLVGQTANGSVRSQTSAYTGISATTWYHFRVKMESSALAVYELYDMDGNLLWTDSLTTNLPTIGAGVQPTFIAYNQIAEARQMCQVDYISFTYPPMNRGALI